MRWVAWLRHVERMDDSLMSVKLIRGQMYEVRKRERSRKR